MTLSVIVPVYNSEKYIRRCLDSILSQTRLPDEIICVDDGSTDGSALILDEYAGKHPMIKVTHQENQGRIRARKYGVELSLGDYISFIDSDDYIDEKMYEDLFKLIEEYGVDYVTSGFLRDYEGDIVTEKERIKRGDYHGKNYIEQILSNLISTSEFYRYNIMGSLCNKILKKNLLEEVMKSIDESLCIGEDDAVCYSFFLKAESVYVSGEEYYHYCIRPDSTSATMDRRNKEMLMKLLEYMKKLFYGSRERVPNIIEQYRIFELFMRLFDNPSGVLSYNGNELFPYGTVNKDDRIVLYGTGSLYQDLKMWLKDNGFNIVAIADKNDDSDGIIKPYEIKNIKFDKVLITAINATVIENILHDLSELGIGMEKVLKMDAELIKKEVGE